MLLKIKNNFIWQKLFLIFLCTVVLFYEIRIVLANDFETITTKVIILPASTPAGGGGGGGSSVETPRQTPSSGAKSEVLPGADPAFVDFSKCQASKIKKSTIANYIKNLVFLNVKQLASVAKVAEVLDMGEAIIEVRTVRLSPVIKGQMERKVGIKLQKTLQNPLTNVLAAVSVINPAICSNRGMEGFVDDMVAVLGNKTFVNANINKEEAEVVTDVVASIALGNPIDRRTFDKKFIKLGKVLYEREREVVGGGDFQLFFKRKPKTDEEWKVIKRVAYRGQIMPIERSTKREVVAREKYEKIFKIDLTQLANSKISKDKEKVAKAWSFIRVVAASDLEIK